MTTNADEPSSLTYELSCTDCSYQATVEGSVYDALELARAHRKEYGETRLEHFVDFEIRDGHD